MSVINTAGMEKLFDFAGLPVPEPMQRSLAAVFAAQSKGWNSHLSAGFYWVKIGLFAGFLSQLEDPPEDLDELTAAVLKRWRARHIGTNTGRGLLLAIRTLLRHDTRLTSGPAAEELARRVPAPTPGKQSYEDAERERVRLAAQRQFRAAVLRIAENTLLLERWRTGALVEGSREWKLGRVLDHLACTGDVPRTILPSGQANVTNTGLLGGTNRLQTWGRLFLTRMEITSLAVLLTDRFAWNLSVYDRMPAPTSAPSAGETASVTYQVQIDKRRSGRDGSGWRLSTENITDSGADSPGRLITQALGATAVARSLAARLAPGTDLLMVSRTARPALPGHQDTNRPAQLGPLSFGVSGGDAREWARIHKLGGSPFQRTRRTTVTREGRPMQHAQGTHESVYVLPDLRVQRVSRDVFEAGATEALHQATAVVFGGRITAEPDPDHEETATADCADDTTSPWPAPGGGCGADFLLCLGCRNAHVHPGHHPRLAHLHQQLQGLRSALDDRIWRERWNSHLLRLEDLRDKVGPAAWNAALDRVDNNDRTLVHLLVKGELAS
ncbi:hypothetical protein [Streptomyces globosus]|uniref:hypothetical protein n=1 Tax=Streptomyces globosus TaxID=68209 RepID=UPI0031CDEDF8